MEEEYPSFDLNFEFLEPKNEWDKLVMQCFLVVYREYPTRELIFLGIHTSLVGYFTVDHEKALYN